MTISFVVLVILVSCRNEAKKRSAKVWYLLLIYNYFLLSSCWLPRCPCHLQRHSRCLRILFASSLPCSRLAVALPSPCRRLASPRLASPSPRPPFCLPSSSWRPPSLRHRRSLSLPVLLAKYPHIWTGNTAVSKYHKVVTYLYPSSQLTWLLWN